ncbi:MAG: PASTA domain-containing protein [Solobacterium sp.]|nr:PASTA domain-containing protein [Solobacterium sp.]
MAQRDFMRELAQELEDKKSGKREKIDSIADYQPRNPVKYEENLPEEEEFDIPEPVKEPVKPVRPAAPKEEPEKTTVPEEPEEIVMPEPDDDVFDDRPASFQEETLQKVEKPKRTLKTPVKIGLGAGAALLCLLLWWLFLAPKIKMPDFVGKNLSEVSTWARQNKIENTAVAITNEYSFDVPADVVISQSITPGKKVKTSTPMTFVVSLGADPDELIDFPDIRNMTQDEIREWISENKLQKVKLTTQYSTTVENGHVISYDLRNVDEGSFTRGTNLSIVVSKGEAPAGQVTVENFVGRTVGEAENWARTKKIALVKTEVYSDKEAAGTVISQSVASGQAMKEGETLTVTVSKGKGVQIPNLVGYTQEQFEAWKADPKNSVTVVPKSVYNEAPAGTVIYQSLPAGSLVDSGTVLEVTISLYLPRLETATDEWIGVNYFKLENYIDDLNTKGARIQAGEYGAYATRVYSNYPKDTIVAIHCDNTNQGIAKDGCERPLNLDARISYQVSLGPKDAPAPSPEVKDIVLSGSDAASLSAAQSFCNSNGLSCTYVQDNSIENIQIEVGGHTVKTNDSTQYVIKSNEAVTIKYNNGESSSEDEGGSSGDQTSGGETGQNEQGGNG